MTPTYDDFLGFGVVDFAAVVRFGAALVVVAVDFAAVVRFGAALVVVAVDFAAVVRFGAALVVVARPLRGAGFTSVAGSYVATSARSLMM